MKATIYPQSVLAGDATKQNYSLYPRAYYVDTLKECGTCGRPFIFFAKEQRFWFETLRFYVDANCALCPVCRRNSQDLRRRLRRYSDLFTKKTLTQKDLISLVDDGGVLLASGVLRDLDRLGRLKNEALRSIPEYPGTKGLAQAIKQARVKREP